MKYIYWEGDEDRVKQQAARWERSHTEYDVLHRGSMPHRSCSHADYKTTLILFFILKQEKTTWQNKRTQ